ncbi:MAG: RNB domain-containing ribonuclease [Candidatus Phosphoribacter sp.]|nr:RNB domain-containing ribonuclease [Actinomycetales bacterium]
MPSRAIRYRPGPPPTTAIEPGSLARRFAAIREELNVPAAFPAAVLAEAEAASRRGVPEAPDRTDLAFWTLDPPGSMDLDQAMFLTRQDQGYRVHYAIADVPAFVVPGGPIDVEARLRGQTIYLPDGRVPLHPPTLSEGAASLLPGQVRAAYVWEFVLDADAVVISTSVARALVRSRERRDYAEVQARVETIGADAAADTEVDTTADAAAADDASAEAADQQMMLLRQIGTKRMVLESARGGASLPMPEQQVVHDAAGRYRLEYRPPLAAEDWNAQISLMTGMAAAELMLAGGVGVLRTMPAPDPQAVRRFRRQARAVGVNWPDGQRYGDFLRSLDRRNPRHLALIHEATSLFRGAAYTPFDGPAPEQRLHAAVAAPYAHVTAPLRRLVDRFGLVVCAAVSAGTEVPGWARSALPELTRLMADGDRRASAVERACTDAVEAAVLASEVGKDFPATVVDRTSKGLPIVQLAEPAVLTAARGAAQAGDEVTVRVVGADVATGRVDLDVVSGGSASGGSSGSASGGSGVPRAQP